VRPGEVEGVDYHFLTQEAFKEGIARGDFLEYDEHYGHFYGTRRQDVESIFAAGEDAITDLNWPGVVQVLAQLPGQVRTILIRPPSLAALEERLHKRTAAGGKPLSPERMARIQDDFGHIDDLAYVFTNPDMLGSKLTDYDRVIINDDLNEAIEQVLQEV
jgi:guanylate kinase